MQVRIVIHGQVQGVFYRHSAKQLAEGLGIVGWIRNNPDGSVEAVACGPKDKLVEFIAWCKKGPPFAKIEDVEVEWSEVGEHYGGFEIIR